MTEKRGNELEKVIYEAQKKIAAIYAEADADDENAIAKARHILNNFDYSDYTDAEADIIYHRIAEAHCALLEGWRDMVHYKNLIDEEYRENKSTAFVENLHYIRKLLHNGTIKAIEYLMLTEYNTKCGA